MNLAQLKALQHADIDKLLLYEYHLQLYSTLNGDIAEHQFSQYNEDLNADLVARYGTDLFQASKQACEYHGKRADELSGGKTWREFMGSYWSALEEVFNDYSENLILTVLGGEPAKKK